MISFNTLYESLDIAGQNTPLFEVFSPNLVITHSDGGKSVITVKDSNKLNAFYNGLTPKEKKELLKDIKKNKDDYSAILKFLKAAL